MNDKESIAIHVHNVHKSFKLPHERQTSIKGLFVNMFRGGRSFERQKVLNKVDLTVKKGEFFGIIGRNGSGKSTLLKLLAGIYTPDKGSIQITGNLTPFIELGVGFNPELTGRENVYLNGSLLGFNRSEMSAMFKDIVAFAELEQFMDQKLKNYSSGMQVRLAFSIAIRAQTDILLLDEVLAVGDVAFQKKCINYFTKLKKEGKTVIFVSHDMSSVERFCDKVLVMDKGVVDGIYETKEAINRYKDYNLRSELKDRNLGNVFESETIQDATGDKQKKIIKEVRILSASQTDIVTYGEPLIGEIFLDSRAVNEVIGSKEKLYSLVTFFNQDSILLGTIKSDNIRYSNQDKAISFTINKTPFKPGVYSAYVGIYVDDGGSGVALDTTTQPTNFGVESGGLNFNEGILHLTAEWSEPHRPKATIKKK